MKLALLLFTLFSIQNLWAIPENAQFTTTMNEQVLPYFFENAKIESLKTQDGINVKYAKFVKMGAVANIVISNGRTESYIKYAELVYDLKDYPVNLFLIDHRGQGFSDRMLEDKEKGYVKDFNDYVADFDLLVKAELQNKKKSLKNYLIAHSMGGGIATRYMELHPTVFTRALLSAPMYDIQTNPYPRVVAYSLVNVLNMTGQGKSYAPGKGPYKSELDTFEKNTATHSQLRFEWNKSLLTTYPEILLADPTNAWVLNALKASDMILRDAKKIKTPMTIMQATDESYVQNSAIDKVCKLAPACKVVVMNGARHEMFMEQDAIRNYTLNLIKELYRKGR